MPLLMCPNCNESMQEVRRNDVQIDMCPKCRGVWLDRGELDAAGEPPLRLRPAQQEQGNGHRSNP